MLALVLIYFVGKAFYNLAEKHNKSAWGFAVLGVLSYYGGTIIGGLIILVLYEVVLLKSFDDADSMLINIISIPIGILVCWLFYLILESTWSKRRSNSLSSEDVLDAELIKNNESENVDHDKES